MRVRYALVFAFATICAKPALSADYELIVTHSDTAFGPFSSEAIYVNHKDGSLYLCEGEIGSRPTIYASCLRSISYNTQISNGTSTMTLPAGPGYRIQEENAIWQLDEST